MGETWKDSGDSNSRNQLLARQRVRASVIFNTRPSPGLHEIQKMMRGGSQARWGNDIGYVLLPVPLSAPDDPLQHVHNVKGIFDRKKLSLGPMFSYKSGSLLMKITGVAIPTKFTYRCVANTTLSFSNVVGPVEEIELFGHPITHILPTSSGLPQALCVHCLSYMGHVSIILSAAKDIIPDPEILCKYMTEALKDMQMRSIVS